jgi:hypothetical protein
MAVTRHRRPLRDPPDRRQPWLIVAARGAASGGRTWWAHLEFTRINIELIILPKKIEDLRGRLPSQLTDRQREGSVCRLCQGVWTCRFRFGGRHR